MIPLKNFIRDFSSVFPDLGERAPWEITNDLQHILVQMIATLSTDFNTSGEVAIHKSAVIGQNVIFNGPVVVGENCTVGANSTLRAGVFLDRLVAVGPSCEIKQSVIFSDSKIAHLNYI